MSTTGDRPNRWTGPPSTWRSYTREERNVTSSLDAIRSQDLSIHLYNAYAIKSRVRANHTGKDNYSGADESEFVPPDLWTAWPMPAEDVPQGPYLPNMGGQDSWRMEEDPRSSARLEEMLLATTTKIARERWRARRWEWSGSKVEAGVKKGENAVKATSDENSSLQDEPVSPDKPMFSSQTFDALGRVSSSSDDDRKAISGYEVEAERRTVPLADDDRARQLLLPSIRHIISKVDDLLSGLQKAREAYASNWNKAKKEDTTQGDETGTGADTSTSRSRSKQPGKRARTSSVDSDASVMSTNSASSRGRRKPKTRQLKLRDWSDVLGMAALTGWNPDVVQRAAERCSSLFGENMLFRTFHEGDSSRKSCFTEQLANGQEPGHSDVEESAEGTQEEYGANITTDELNETAMMADTVIRCPVKSCLSHKTSFARGAFMYNHVRKHHPDVDIGALKKLEAKRRRGRRGKYNRGCRHRSLSAAASSSP